jgi:transposase-like protein
MDTMTCPSCGMDNAFFRIMTKKGAWYECPDCDYEWCDETTQIEDETDELADN